MKLFSKIKNKITSKNLVSDNKKAANENSPATSLYKGRIDWGDTSDEPRTWVNDSPTELEKNKLCLDLLEKKNSQLQNEISFVYRMWKLTNKKSTEIEKVLDLQKKENDYYKPENKIINQLSSLDFTDK